MKIIIFGGTGFIGRQISLAYEISGYDVYNVSRNPSSLGKSKEIICDIGDYENVEKIIENIRPEIVISTAWNTSYNDYKNSKMNFFYQDCTVNLAKVSIKYSVNKLLVLGSCSEYGINNTACIAGQSKLIAHDNYSASKIESFKQIESLINIDRIKFNWIRIFQPFGVGQDSKRLIPYMANEFTKGLIPTINYPFSFSDWVTTRDIGKAVYFISKNLLPTEIDIGTSIKTKNIELLFIISQLMGKSIQSFEYAQADEHAGTGLIVDKRSPILISGWRPSDSLEVGLNWLLKENMI